MTRDRIPPAGLRGADAEARRVAVRSFDRPLALEAGAGTGKTATLVARVLAWCLGPGWARHASGDPGPEGSVAARVLSRVMAITFTEKAAAEMSGRVALGFASLARGEAVLGLDGVVDPADPEVQGRAQALLELVDRLGIQTVHAWCFALMRRNPLEVGISPAAEVDADGSLVRETVHDQVGRSLCAVLDAHPGAVQRLLAAGIGPARWADAVVALVQANAKTEDLRRGDPASLARELVQRFRSDLREIEGIAGEVPRPPRTLDRLLDGIRGLVERLGMAEGVDARVLLLADGLEGLDKGIIRWAGGRFYKASERSLSEADRRRLRGRAAKLRARLDGLGGAAGLRELLPELYEALVVVLGQLLEPARAALHRAGVLTFTSLLRRARDLLRRSPDALAEVRGSLDQVLVDEFQDTDPVQCELIRLVALRDPSSAPGLFVVGDPKQSIYGWRSADLGAYHGFLEELLRAGGAVHRLAVNYRSAPPILAEVDRAIGPLMEATPDLSPHYQPLLPCDAKRSQRGFAIPASRGKEGEPPVVAVSYLVSGCCSRRRVPEVEGGLDRVAAEQARIREAHAVAREIRRLHDAGHLRWEDVGLLLRTTTSLETYLEALREQGIPYDVRGEKAYYQRREVVDAVSLVAAVLDPSDLLSAVAWLRSPAVGVPDAAWRSLWSAGLPALLVDLDAPSPETHRRIDALVASASVGVPSELVAPLLDWPAGLARGLRTLASLRSSCRSEAADLFVDRLRRQGLAEAVEASRHLGRHRVARLRRFFEVLREVLLGSRGGAHAVARELRARLDDDRDEIVESGAAGRAVEVSTVHAAKGLAYGHVYLVDAHRGSTDRVSGDCLVEWHEDRLALRLFGVASEAWPELRARRRETAQGELIRTLYVAMTRARERLVVAGAWPLTLTPARTARSHAELLSPRYPLRSDEGVPLDPGIHQDTHGVLWRSLLGPEPGVEGEPASAGTLGLARREPPAWLPACLRRLQADAGTLARHRREAEARMAVPLLSGVTSGERRGAEGRIEGEGSARFDVDPGPPASDPSLAAAVGTTIHLALETLDLSLPVPEALGERAARVAGLVPADLSQSEAERCAEESAALLRAFGASELARRMDSLEILARELPLLLAGDAEAPAGEGLSTIRAGVLDLLLRDPASGDLLVVDYKTDRISTPSQLRARASQYAVQGRAYTQAVMRAMGLERPPRFELWFLRAGRAVSPEEPEAFER